MTGREAQSSAKVKSRTAGGLKKDEASRHIAAEHGYALPNGKFPIRNRKELASALRFRTRAKGVSQAAVNAHIRRRATELGVKVDFAAKNPDARSRSLKWPHLYDILRSKGYDKSKAAAISNSRVGMRKGGRVKVLGARAAHNPKVLANLNRAITKGKHYTPGKSY